MGESKEERATGGENILGGNDTKLFHGNYFTTDDKKPKNEKNGEKNEERNRGKGGGERRAAK